MTVVIAVIESVESKDTSKGEVFEITLEDGTVCATFDEDLAAAAEELEGEPARLEIETRKNGKYTNHYLQDVEAADEEDLDDAKPKTRRKTTTRTTGSGRAKAKTSSTRRTGGGGGGAAAQAEKDENIRKAVLFKECGNIVSGLAAGGKLTTPLKAIEAFTTIHDALAEAELL